MKSVSNKKSFFYPSSSLINKNIPEYKYLSSKFSFIKNKKDESEKELYNFISDKEKFKIEPYFGQKEVVDFLSSKFTAMKKMNLDDECYVGKIETKKINIDKNVFPKPTSPKNKKWSCSPKKVNKCKKSPKKNSKNKSNNKNIIVDVNGKILKHNMEESIDLNNISLDKNKEAKQRELNQFFSNKVLLNSIVNELKEH